MNSLYGRFGMNSDLNFTDIISKDNEISFINRHDIIINNVETLNSNFSLINYSKKINEDILENFNMRIDWASIITSESRILIQQLKELVNIYYIDTDCLIIPSKDLSKLSNFIDNKSLGSLKIRSEEHTSELQSLMRISYAVFCLKKQHILTTL